jgi:hypothetical protein
MRKLIALGLLIAGQVHAQGAAEKISAHLHEGVASCAASQCHGATKVSNQQAVQMNEFALWQEFDPHAKAYDILLTPESQAIARKLGLGKAEEAKVCLDCHADNVAADKRGERFQIDDGIGCEACHGGSENWLASHTKADHAANLAAGLYPTEEPIARSALCLSCHAGTRDRMITHRIMGAGHPRLSFELDTFTWLHPHYQIDDDYTTRKGRFDGLRDWGIGQGTAAVNALDILLDERSGWHGIFPELVLFDCHACHRSMSGRQWGPRQGTGLGPGVVRLNDSNLVMFRHVLAAIDSSGAQALFDQTRALHQATTEGREQTFAAARKLRDSIGSYNTKIATFDFAPETLGVILGSMVRDAERGEFRDFAAAEQASMGVQSVVVAFENSGRLDERAIETIRARVDALYTTVENDERYSMDRFIAALKSVRAAAP